SHRRNQNYTCERKHDNSKHYEHAAHSLVRRLGPSTGIKGAEADGHHSYDNSDYQRYEEQPSRHQPICPDHLVRFIQGEPNLIGCMHNFIRCIVHCKIGLFDGCPCFSEHVADASLSVPHNIFALNNHKLVDCRLKSRNGSSIISYFLGQCPIPHRVSYPCKIANSIIDLCQCILVVFNLWFLCCTLQARNYVVHWRRAVKLCSKRRIIYLRHCIQSSLRVKVCN
ncbi:hypothetical protein PMAYCL1PPCAC_04510, partial [Pristionchus mayeri]